MNILHCNLKQCTFVYVLTKILELNETSDTISNYVADCIIKNNLEEKVVGLCADKAIYNLGGANRKGWNNVFIKLHQKLNHNLP